jgi:SOS-response transcriptional repressor LexA
MTEPDELLRIIDEFCASHGFSPTVRELQERLGVRSMGTIHRRLVALRDKGLVAWEPNRYRTIRTVVPQPS